MRLILFFIIGLLSHIATSAQTISIEEIADDVVALPGISTEFLYPILRGQPNADTSAYDSIWWSDQVLDEISTLDVGFLRFPGGTISQYYHAGGVNGYGTRDLELDCRSNFIDIPGFAQKVRVDGAYPDNMIHYYVDLHQKLEARQDRSIETLYVINMMTHFFNGDFWDANPFIDALIAIHGAGFEFYLNNTPALLTPEQTAQAAQIIRAVYEDPLMDNIIESVISQPGFIERLQENLAGIQFLLSQDITVSGVELGNENYSFTMLKDDDLSEIPFDCTTPDSIVTQFLPLSLPLKAYMQGIIKFAFLSEVYDYWIDELFELPTGMVMHGSSFKIQPNGGSYEIEALGGENPRFFEIWNRFLGQLDFYDGAIVHIYAKSQPDCSVLEESEVSDLEDYSKAYFDFYFDEVLDYQIDRLREETGRDELWITEWNMNTANIFGNTFQHAHFISRFMDAMNRHSATSSLKFIGLHNLAAWRYNQFAVFRTDEFDSQFMIERQSVYHPYQQFTKMAAEGYKLVNLDMSQWLGNSWYGSPSQYFFPYYREASESLLIHFVQQDGTPLNFNWDNIQFHLNGMVEPRFEVVAAAWDYIEAPSILASNEGCSDHPEDFPEYSIVSGEGEPNGLSLGPYAVGSVQLTLDMVDDVANNQVNAWKIFPNPALDYIRLESQAPHFAVWRYRLFNNLGQIAFSGEVGASTNIDVRSLMDGLYLLELASGDGTYESHPIIIRNR